MQLVEQPLTDESLDDVVAFLRRANPFAEKALGWDTGRFVDFRWGIHAVRAQDDPGLLGRLCRVYREAGEIRAITVNEDGRSQEFIITAAPDPDAARFVLPRLTEAHRERGIGLEFEISVAEEWLADVFADAGLTEVTSTGHEWEYELGALSEAAPVAEGFTIATLEDVADRAAVYASISDCIGAAFGRDADRTPILRSLEDNPMFRPNLSVFALSPDNRVAAYCRGTVDPDNGVCGIDPVCTHPEFQRLGLGKATVQRCFTNQRAAGGRFSYIGSEAEPAPGTFLYKSLGPAGHTTCSTWSL